MSEDANFALAGLAGMAAPAGLGTAYFAFLGGFYHLPLLLAGFGAGCFVAFLHLFLVGLPLWGAVSRFMPIRRWTAGLLGAVVGVVPLGFFSLISAAWSDLSPGQAVGPLLFCALCGASSGLAIRTVRPLRPVEEAA
ncbi:hypothetical protein [Sphingomonas kyeonggiensis]|uniref:Uncharacterized protein n=1 Tax=Sphingomonas kyeonggiensis TaxID=1268553 RepID=A0A7W6NXH7_9SPHN|nr:hypothetical protein [Sphingomonas kyeonggiensis]MBB4098589.1 hypothetical protein [Sphingomonas kyeonggiensis]